MPDWQTKQDEYDNALIAAGAVVALLHSTQNSQLTAARVVEAADGSPTNQIDVEFAFMRSPYRLTIERVSDDDEGTPNA